MDILFTNLMKFYINILRPPTYNQGLVILTTRRVIFTFHNEISLSKNWHAFLIKNKQNWLNLVALITPHNYSLNRQYYNQPKYISVLILECESDLARQVCTDIFVLYFSLFNFVNKPRFLQDEASFTPFCWYQGIFMLSSDSKVIGF